MMPAWMWAQLTSGEVIFEEKINMHIDLPEEQEHIKAMMPEFRTVSQSLIFNEQFSIYQEAERDDKDDETIEAGDGNVQIRMVIQRSENKLFKDLEAGTKLEQRDIFDKMFLIKDELETYEWKLGTEQKEILGYACQEATFEDSSRKVVAWFTPQIPVSSGPGNLGQLPGMILEVDINDGKRKITAVEVNSETPEKNQLKAPSKGKTVTQKEFDRIFEEKRKEMQAEMGGDGAVIRIRRN